jgi:hypothetical protein
MFSLGECSMTSWKDCVVHCCYVDFRSMMLIGCTVQTICFCCFSVLVALSIAHKGNEKSSRVTVDLHTSPFSFVHCCLVCCEALWLSVCAFRISLFFWWIHSFIVVSCSSVTGNFLCSSAYFIRY